MISTNIRETVKIVKKIAKYGFIPIFMSLSAILLPILLSTFSEKAKVTTTNIIIIEIIYFIF